VAAHVPRVESLLSDPRHWDADVQADLSHLARQAELLGPVGLEGAREGAVWDLIKLRPDLLLYARDQRVRWLRAGVEPVVSLTHRAPC